MATPLSKEKESQLWLRRIQQGLDWRRQNSYEDEWNDINRIFSHHFHDMAVPHFNVIYLMGMNMMPNLVFQNPGIINTPTSGQMIFWASFFDSIDNWWVRHAELKDLSRQVVLSSYLHNTTATQFGYDFETEADLLRRREQEIFANLPGVVDRSRARNAPWVDFIPSHRFVDAPGTRVMRNCPWCAKFVSVKSKILKDIKGLRNTKPSPIPDQVKRYERRMWDQLDENLYTGLWQIHDAETGRWAMLSTNGNFILPFTEDPLQVYGLPFEVVSFNPSEVSQWGTPDAIYIKTQQIEGDESRMQGMFQRRQSIHKFVYDANVFDEDDVNKILNAQVSVGIPADIPDGSMIGNHVMQVNTQVDPGKIEYQKELLEEVKLLTGQGPNQLGNYASGRRSATEANIVAGNSNVRLGDRRVLIADMIKNHTVRANTLISANWSQSIVEQVVGVDGALYWVEASPKQLNALKEGLVTEVNVESLAPVSRERRKQEAADLLMMLGQMQQAGVNTLPLIKQLLSQYEWVDVRQVLPQVADQMNIEQFEAQQRQMLSGPVGPTAAANLAAIPNLADRAPTQGDNDNGSTEEDR